MLRVEGLSVRRGSRPVLRGVDLAADPGEVVGLVGANGAGKSTLLAALAGLVRAGRGATRLDGRRIDGLSPQRLVRAGVALVPQGRRLFPGLTVRRNLELGAFSVPDTATVAVRVDAFLERYPNLAGRRDTPAGSLSGGEQGLLALGRALMSEPRVLLLDEPLAGLDRRTGALVLDQVVAYARAGAVVLMAEHDHEAVHRVASRVLALEDGVALEDGEARPPAARP